jgi:hypothetical protein
MTIAFTGSFCALAVSPYLSFEPINLIKLFGLVIGAGIILPSFVTRIRLQKSQLTGLKSLTLLLTSILCLILVTNAWVYRDSFSDIFLGVFGRNNGILSYLALMLIFAASIFIEKNQYPLMIRAFEITGNIVLAYATIQILGLDPIDWTGEGPFSTLGNLNFSAAFMAMHASIIIVKIFFNRELVWHTRTWFALVLLLELFVIWKTTSIQGLAMILIVSTLLGIRFLSRMKIGTMLPMLVVSVTGGAIVFLGSLGIGPFGFLRQETMLFRVDYWSAGLAMIAKNSIFGLGMDQYGNFYREYRNSAAATRNYFDRTANTAHNIPIDVAVGAGLVAGICFLLIMFISLYISLKYILTLNDFIGMTLGVVCIGFIFQQFVSINQIGTAVWGWIFMGLIVNRSSQSLNLDKVLYDKRSSLKAKSIYIGSDFNRPKQTRHFLLKITSKLIVVFVAVSLVINPLIRDAQFSRAVKKGDLERQWELAEAPGSNQFLMEFVLKNAVAQNDPSKILKYAQQTSNRYPRSFYAWSVRAGLITSTLEERKRALEVLRSLDPLNTDIPMSPIEG